MEPIIEPEKTIKDIDIKALVQLIAAEVIKGIKDSKIKLEIEHKHTGKIKSCHSYSECAFGDF